LKQGDFIRILTPEFESFGIGKLTGYENGVAKVSFFDSPVSDTHVVETPISTIRPAPVPPQTRAYWFDVGQNVWRVGRVMYHEDGEVDIRFPNQKDLFIPEADVFVRWDVPLADPTGHLASKINETPLFSDARSKYVQALTAQRRATMGMPGLFSSIVDLEPHQIEVVKRVLQDPVQRYLLADEVGLGKTIEAGVLIRQYVLDDPAGHRVVIIVPPALVTQWRDELSRRFIMDAELDDTITVVPSDSFDEVVESLNGVGMVVVDEAHHIHKGHWLYETLKEATTRIPRFLLLSATPVLGNETGFLEMLHLLDPLVFPLEKLTDFQSKISNRQALAEAVAGLIPENLLQLDEYLENLTEMFPDDAQLTNLATRLARDIERFPDEDDPEFLEALYSLRAHVSETYRLDRRILRNRRKGVPGLTPDRNGLLSIEFVDPSMEQVIEALEDWRIAKSLELDGQEMSEASEEATKWFFGILEGLFSRVSPEHLITDRVNPRLLKAGPGEGQKLSEIVYRLKLLGKQQEAFSSVVETIQASDEKTKFILFCSDREVANTITNHLASHLSMPIDRYEENHSEDYSESVFARFQKDPLHRIIVCDQRAEEGLNLQGGDKVLIHFDLPFSPNRVEQRIGRVDRYGSGSSIQSKSVRCVSNPYEMAWNGCLENGLGVFSRSIASLQYLIDGEMRSLERSLLFEGVDAITNLQSRLGGKDGTIARELRRIDDQDALDALIVPNEENYDDLFEEDGNWQAFQGAVDGWLVNILKMQKTDGPSVGKLPKGDAIIRYKLSRQGGSKTLIPLDRFLDNFLSVVDTEARGSSYSQPLTYPYTARRQTALMSAAREKKVRLLRYGDMFLKGLNELTALDDRGRSVAVWRQRSGYRSEGLADVFFRFDFLIEADTQEAAQTYCDATGGDKETAINALRRRGDMVFPPTFENMWLDAELEPVSDASLLNILQKPYSKGSPEDDDKDQNLNSERWSQLSSLDLPIMDYWSETVEQARKKAETVLRQHINLSEFIQDALKLAKGSDQARFAQLRTRITQARDLEAVSETKLLKIESETAESFYRGLTSPKITVDMIGAVFLSAYGLDFLSRNMKSSSGVGR